MRSIWTAAAVAALVAGCLLAPAPEAHAGGRRILWSETGLQLDDSPIASSARIWARDSGDLPQFGYWNLPNPLTEEPIVSGLMQPAGVAVDVLNGKVYWVDAVSDLVGRRDLYGGAPVEFLFSADESLEGIAVDPGESTIYFTVFDTGLVRRANLDGSEIVTLADHGSGGSGIAIDVPNGKLYYALVGVGEIRRMNLDGSGDELLISTVFPNPRGIALDLMNGLIYWAEDDGEGSIPDNPDNSGIFRANLDGSGVELVVDTGEIAAWGVAIDPFFGDLYWAAPHGLPASCPTNNPTTCTGSIWGARADGSDAALIFYGVPEPKGIALQMPIAPCNRGAKSKLALNPQVKWKWGKGDAVSKQQFGDPTADTNYYLCFFDEELPTPEANQRDVAAVCNLAAAGEVWKDKKNGFKRKTGEQKGILKVLLKAGEAGKAKIKVKGKVVPQPSKPFDQDPDFVVQLVNSDLECWESVFPAPAQKNGPAKFKDKVSD